TEVNRWVATSLFITMYSLPDARSPRRRPGRLLTGRQAPSARRPGARACADDGGMNASQAPVHDSLAGGIFCPGSAGKGRDFPTTPSSTGYGSCRLALTIAPARAETTGRVRVMDSRGLQALTERLSRLTTELQQDPICLRDILKDCTSEEIRWLISEF